MYILKRLKIIFKTLVLNNPGDIYELCSSSRPAPLSIKKPQVDRCIPREHLVCLFSVHVQQEAIHPLFHHLWNRRFLRQSFSLYWARTGVPYYSHTAVCIVWGNLNGEICFLFHAWREDSGTVTGWVVSPLKCVCWSSNPHPLKTRLCLEKRSVKRSLKWGHIGGPSAKVPLREEESPDWCGSVGWASSHKLKGHQFNSPSGHMPELQARSQVGDVQKAT